MARLFELKSFPVSELRTGSRFFVSLLVELQQIQRFNMVQALRTLRFVAGWTPQQRQAWPDMNSSVTVSEAESGVGLHYCIICDSLALEFGGSGPLGFKVGACALVRVQPQLEVPPQTLLFGYLAVLALGI